MAIADHSSKRCSSLKDSSAQLKNKDEGTTGAFSVGYAIYRSDASTAGVTPERHEKSAVEAHDRSYKSALHACNLVLTFVLC